MVGGTGLTAAKETGWSEKKDKELFLVGKPSDRLMATEAIWGFFQAHPATGMPGDQ
jgi:hypothetical protein